MQGKGRVYVAVDNKSLESTTGFCQRERGFGQFAVVCPDDHCWVILDRDDKCNL